MRSAVRQDVFLLNRQKSYLPLHRRPCLLRCFLLIREGLSSIKYEMLLEKSAFLSAVW